jgi:hypothetical protein
MTAAKYNNKKQQVGSSTFDSKAEAQRYVQLLMLQQAGAISGLVLQPKYLLQASFKDKDGHTIRAIHYIADFQYQEAGMLVVEDVKGIETDVFKLKEKLFRFKFPHVDFRIVKM